uniref:Uncharacterized protein n=1 Tax=Neogobius melanostomus TaxID=47308 RepID=A0A8C6U9P1_9GOBI
NWQGHLSGNIEVHPIKHLFTTSSDDGSWRLWALPTSSEPAAALLLSGEGHSDWLTSCSFSPDGDKLATTSGDSTVRVWDLSRGLCLLSLRGHLRATWVHFLPSCDHLLLSSGRDHMLLLWDERASTWASEIRGHAHPVEHCTSDTTGRVAASCDAGGDVKLWDMRSLRSALYSAPTSPSGANQVSLCPAGTGSEEVAVAGGDGLVRLLRPSSGHVTEVGGHQGAACTVCFDHQGETLLSAGADGIVQVWRRSQ